MKSLFFANVTRLLHGALIAFVVIVPFVKQAQWHVLLLHLAVICTLMVHWIVDQDTCFLTIVECFLRGIEPSTSFVHQLVSPVYKIEDAQVKRVVWILTPFLGLLTLTKLWHLRSRLFQEFRLRM